MKWVELLIAAYPTASIKDGTIRAYKMMLAEIDPDVLFAAVQLHIKTNKWFPTIADLTATARDLKELVTGTTPPEAVWGIVQAAIHKHGYYNGMPADLDPLIKAAIQAVGGWAFLCHSQNPTADRARLVKAYEELLNRARQDDAMPVAARELVAGSLPLLEDGDE